MSFLYVPTPGATRLSSSVVDCRPARRHGFNSSRYRQTVSSLVSGVQYILEWITGCRKIAELLTVPDFPIYYPDLDVGQSGCRRSICICDRTSFHWPLVYNGSSKSMCRLHVSGAVKACGRRRRPWFTQTTAPPGSAVSGGSRSPQMSEVRDYLFSAQARLFIETDTTQAG